MLNWAHQFNICCFLDNHQYDLSHSSSECLLAAGARHYVNANVGNALDELSKFLDAADDWIFGNLSYDLKNEIELLKSSHPDDVGFPDLFFFIPEFVVECSAAEIRIGAFGAKHADAFQAIMAAPSDKSQDEDITIGHAQTKSEYLATVQRLRAHIHAGDCYEVNFCQKFFSDNAVLDPLRLYRSLSTFSPNPFSAFYKLDNRYLLCLSPERYVKKSGSEIISQPMKGTSRRAGGSDARSIAELQHDEKERAENIMTVDLVRNDLSKVCEPGSVIVEELCAVYTFPQVFQMVSTVRGALRPGVSITDVIRATFPMGSMTGAPKKKVMELIDRYESSRRGLFSGSVGYITPGGDFDFNVVIRSVLYNRAAKHLAYYTGSAITFNSDPEKEYEECMLKAEAIEAALNSRNDDERR